MNVPYERIEITPPETKINPTGFGLCGSRGTITYGHAISNACEDARKKLFELAVPYLEVTTDSMYLTDYGVAIKARPDQVCKLEAADPAGSYFNWLWTAP